MASAFDLEAWDGRFALMDDGESWLVYALGEKRAQMLLCVAQDRASALRYGRKMAGACISGFLPQRDWIIGFWDQRETLRNLGAKYDRSVRSWYIPEGLVGFNRTKLEKMRPRGPRSYSERHAKAVASAVSDSLPCDWVPLDVPFEDRERVRALGAKFLVSRNLWVISRKGPMEAFEAWLPQDLKGCVDDSLDGILDSPQFLRIPSEDENLARSFGALNVVDRGVWVAPEKSLIEDFEKWLRIPERESPRKSFSARLASMGFDFNRAENHQLALVPNGKKQRFFVHGDFSRPSGEYVIFLNEIPTGWICNYRTKRYVKWTYPHGGDYSENLSQTVVDIEIKQQA